MNKDEPDGQFSGKSGIEEALKRLNAKMVMDLEPTEAEAQTAVAWLLGRKTSADFRRKLKQVLERIGYEELAQRF